MSDTTAGYHRGNEFSREANARTEFNKTRDLRRIMDWVRLRGELGATSYECRIGLGMLHQTCSARFTDLKRDEFGPFLIKLLDHNGIQVRRLTDTGSPAGVWIANVGEDDQDGGEEAPP